MNDIIRTVTDEELSACAEVIRQSFITVAKTFNLTPENAPTNPAFIKERHLVNMRDKGIRMDGLFIESRLVGFVAIEKVSDDNYCMERLSVLPSYRHLGLGKRLMDHVAEFVRKSGGNRISIGIINENTVLKKWYLDYGFRELHTKTFDHLPFTVCYMEKDLNTN